jgi:pantoate kinase
MSAAGAAATALAVAGLSAKSRSEAMEVAHLSDLFGGGGLGGVAAIAGGGGLEFRIEGGMPPRGHILHRPLVGAVLVGVVGGALPSPALLRDPRFLERVAEASEGLEGVLARPGPRRFFELSEQFTDRMALAPSPLLRVLRALRQRGAWAAQAMFGQSFFARPRDAPHRREVLQWLERAGIPVVELSASRTGARAARGVPAAADR